MRRIQISNFNYHLLMRLYLLVFIIPGLRRSSLPGAIDI